MSHETTQNDEMTPNSDDESTTTRLMKDRVKKEVLDELARCVEVCRQNAALNGVDVGDDDTAKVYTKAADAFQSLTEEFTRMLEESGDDWDATVENLDAFVDVSVPWALKDVFDLKKTHRIQHHCINYAMARGLEE